MIQVRVADDHGLKFSGKGVQVTGNPLPVCLGPAEENGRLADPGKVGIDQPGFSLVREFKAGRAGPADGYHLSSQLWFMQGLKRRKNPY